jgi:tRNA (cmo5U34)-methyltransferase
MSSIDKIFATPQQKVDPFQFNEKVAQCFDDMVERSVPFYHQIHTLYAQILEKKNLFQGQIYDLGCSTGSTFAFLEKYFKNTSSEVHYCGIDQSTAMIKKAKEKLSSSRHHIELVAGDISDISFRPANAIIMNYTLQFIPLVQRASILKKIYDSLEPGGLFLMSEKIKSPSVSVHDLMVDLYYDFKRQNGYSEMEIAQKREALDNVLVPLDMEEQLALMRLMGFKACDVIFRWYNFSTFIAIK